MTETDARILLSQSPSFVGKGQHMARGPPSWVSWRPRVAESSSRTLLEARVSRAGARTASTVPSSAGITPTGGREGDELAEMLRHVTLTSRSRDRDLQMVSQATEATGELDSD